MKLEMEKMILFLLLCTCFSIAEPFDWEAAQGIDAGGLSRASFPKGFVFGTATSAYQVEGAASTEGRGPSIWDTFVRIPGNIANNATAEVTVDQYHRYKEDVELMVKMNMDAYRFSISWSRIFPSKHTNRFLLSVSDMDIMARILELLSTVAKEPHLNAAIKEIFSV